MFLFVYESCLLYVNGQHQVQRVQKAEFLFFLKHAYQYIYQQVSTRQTTNGKFKKNIVSMSVFLCRME